ncbi:MAG: hypothetical protein JO352_33820 [Chloroflexi bacterium]|nr:hypothetical protein [Chloroflexota bacterium]MBV9602271.1 hypothetical protein [Chloroflexota bacterium]
MTSQAHESEQSGPITELELAGGAASLSIADSGLQAARNTRLACEGAVSLLFSTSVRDVWDQLVRAGIEWEDKYTRLPEPRTGPR